MPRISTSTAPSSATRRIRLAIVASLLLVLVAPSSVDAAPAPASSAPVASPSSVEADLFALTNGSRAKAGRAGLQRDHAAQEVARTWSERMAATSSLRHNPNLSGQVESHVITAWRRLGENVGVGWSAASLHDAFMGSSGHRANVLGDYNRLGVGAAVDSSGRLWVTLVFLLGPSIDQSGTSPIGNLDSMRADGGDLYVNGWALDRDTSAPIEIHVLVNGTFAGWGYASHHRPDVGTSYPAYGSRRGFAVKASALAATNSVCVYALNVAAGVNTLLGCRVVNLVTDPLGNLDRLTVGPGGGSVAGWAFDPQTTAPIEVHVLVDGRFAGWGYASHHRPDVDAAFPGYGTGHGFNLAFPVSGPVREVCVYAINVGIGSNTLMRCARV